MWWFLGTEIMFFGGMFCAYLIYRRWYFPEFAAASRSLSLPIGTFNTTVLICSSLTVAMSVRAAQLGNRKMQVRMLLLTLVRSEEHTSELQSQSNLVCRLLL